MKETEESLCSLDQLKLENWGLPLHILNKYQRHGLVSMFRWQAECLLLENVLSGQNLVYAAPTSAGKTLVAEMLLLKTVLERKKKVIFILPFISVVREKMLYLQDILAGSGIRVEGFMGSYNPPGGFRAVHVAICTIEKANSLINRLLEERSFDNIGCVVVDEVHLLGDPHRGYLLELLLTKIKFISDRCLNAIQIIGMSATLPNLDDLAKWLKAALYKTDFRPIALKEYLKVDRRVYGSKGLSFSHEICSDCLGIKNDPGDVIYLCIETILQGYSVLVFCATKSWCESVALQIAAEIRRLGCSKNEVALKLRDQLNSAAISDTLEQLKKCPVGLESSLERCISFAVGYHHAGLTMNERDIIEGAFRNNTIRVIVATSTLSSGVNLPARRVIIRSPVFAGNKLDVLAYKQMVGRAGRMGKDTEGESYLICTEQNKNIGQALVNSELPKVESCLGRTNLSSSLKRALIEILACGMANSKLEVLQYVNCTLLAATSSQEVLHEAIASCLKYLEKHNFISSKDSSSADDLIASSLAVACLSASVAPDQAIVLLQELDNARRCFVLESDLHAIYQVTPFSICDHITLDWMKMFTVWEALTPGMQKVGHLVGVDESFIIKAMRSVININSDQYATRLSIHKRFYTALALQDLINEVPLREVSTKFDFNKGTLQSLQQSASTFSGMVTIFCRKLGWTALEVVLAELGARIQFGVQRDLLDLMRLDCMTGQLARALYSAGIQKVPDLAHSDLRAVLTAIERAKPFFSEHPDIVEDRQKNTVCLPGRPGLTAIAAADIFIHEARSFLLKEMGVQNADWNDASNDLVDSSFYENSTLPPPNRNRNSFDKYTPNAVIELKLKSKLFVAEDLPVSNSKNQSLTVNVQRIQKENTSIVSTKIIGSNEEEVLAPSTQELETSEIDCSLENISAQFSRKDSVNRRNVIVEKGKDPMNFREMQKSRSPEELLLAPATQDFDSSRSINILEPPLADVDLISPKYLKTSMLNESQEDLFLQKADTLSLRLSESFLCSEQLDKVVSSKRNSNADFTIPGFTFVKASTPIGSPDLLQQRKEESSSETVRRDRCMDESSDMFDSPVDEHSKSTAGKNNTNLIEFDPNWGGDSILQVSFVDQEMRRSEFQPISFSANKRKLSAHIAPSKDTNLIKKPRYSNVAENDKKTRISDFFDSFAFDTQVEMEVFRKERKINSVLKSEQLVQPPKNTTSTDSFLLNAFEQTFSSENKHHQSEIDNIELKNNGILKEESPKFCTPKKPLSSCSTVSPKSSGRSPKCRSKLKYASSPSKYPPIDVNVIKSPMKSFPPVTGGKSTEGVNFVGNQPHDIASYSKSENLVINLCNQEVLFADFLTNLKRQKEVAISVSIENIQVHDKSRTIGARLVKNNSPAKVFKLQDEDRVVSLIALTWGYSIYLLDFRNGDCSCSNNLKIVTEVLGLKLIGYKTKEQIKFLAKCCAVPVKCNLYDVSVAHWLLEPGEKDYTLEEIVSL